MTAPRGLLVVVEAPATLVAELQRAVGAEGPHVVAATDTDWRERMSTAVSCVLVDVSHTRLSASDWLLALDGVSAPPHLIALVDTEAEASRWLGAGASDWVLRGGLVGLGPALTRVERDMAERERRESREHRFHEASEALTQLARSPHRRGDDLRAALREITELATRGIDTTRAGVWLYIDDGKTLEAADLYDSRSGTHAHGMRLVTADHPRYYAELNAQRLLPVTLAQTDPRTVEFRDSYFVPEGIVSTLDSSVRLRGIAKGCICIEHCGQPRRWSPEEEIFVVMLADAVSLALESAERFRAESALQETEQRFRDVFRYSNDSIVLFRVEPDGRVLCEDFNPAAERVSGFKREQLIGREVEAVLEPVSAAKLSARYQECIRRKQPIAYEQEIRVPSGVRRYNTSIVPMLDEAGVVRRLAAVARDVTTQRESEALQRQLEAQLAESQKNEALARVAAHIAHDVNNLLTVITAHAARPDEEARGSDAGRAILQATARGRELTQQVLTFGRRRPPERRPMELGPLLRETIQLLGPTAGSVVVDARVGALGVRVLGDPLQLLQVLTNLFTNAVHAMPSGGRLTLALETVQVDEAMVAKHASLQPGGWVRLTVADTGVGMDSQTAARIFEPFFTTRPEGKGTGLGLAVVQSIVTAHEGVIVVDSAPGRGTAFHLYFRPFAEDLARPGAGRHLLLVDDHPGMARVSAKLLETLGYRTTVFDDPREALEAFRAAPTEFDAVLTDLSMPQMSGQDFTRALRALRPSLPVIVSSGMASELEASELRELGIAGVLLKPWRVEEAVATLQQALHDDR